MSPVRKQLSLNFRLPLHRSNPDVGDAQIARVAVDGMGLAFIEWEMRP